MKAPPDQTCRSYAELAQDYPNCPACETLPQTGPCIPECQCLLCDIRRSAAVTARSTIRQQMESTQP